MLPFGGMGTLFCLHGQISFYWQLSFIDCAKTFSPGATDMCASFQRMTEVNLRVLLIHKTLNLFVGQNWKVTPSFFLPGC